MSKDYGLVNAWLPDGTWAGFFMDAASAKSWLKDKGYDLKACEVSNRKFIREPKTEDAK